MRAYILILLSTLLAIAFGSAVPFDSSSHNDGTERVHTLNSRQHYDPFPEPGSRTCGTVSFFPPGYTKLNFTGNGECEFSSQGWATKYYIIEEGCWCRFYRDSECQYGGSGLKHEGPEEGELAGAEGWICDVVGGD